ncbi:MAG: hypothetical protein AAF525_07185 [Pseudomonadota bacterium]
MKFSVDHDRKIIDVDADELDFARLLNELKNIEALDPSNTYDLLVTVGDADRPALTLPEIERASSAVDELRRLLQSRRIAAIVPEGIRFGVGRQIQAVTENLQITSYRPFTNRGDALRWLGHDSQE